MAAITSSSTYAQVQAAYLDNVGYAEDDSPSKAKAFITACRALLLHLPKQSAHGSSSTSFNPDLIQKEMVEAREWLSVNDTTSSTSAPKHRYISLGGFRS